MNAAKLGDLVRQRRKELRMNQGSLAMVSGTGLRFISELERGKETCEVGKTLQVLENLGIEITVKPRRGS
ncbi:MAG: transcriptional regulator [Verrucomicrobiaceae bacterium]|nr:MAG: transcriptional regulator [Verrucomicrobiaceae bacterium]